MSVLAINGGTPVISQGEYNRVPWPPVDEETAELVKKLYLSGEWSFNSQAEQDFENEFAAFHDAKYGIFMANGTVTLECALIALGIGPGDEVIVPGFTWLATAMAVVYTGATPVFVDVEPDTFCLSPEAVEKAITKKTKAVIPVHLYGSMADLEKLLAITNAHNIALIEDCAHMHGGKWNGKGVGSWGNIGSFSFQQSKIMSSGEGGICLTNDRELADRIYRAKHIGYSRFDEQGTAKTSPPAEMICHNYRGLAISALILSRQLKELPARLKRINAFVAELRKTVGAVPGIRIQTPGRLASPQGCYALQIIFDPEIWGNAAPVGAALQAEGVPTAAGNYGPVYKHMLFNTAKYRNTGCPNADFAGLQALSFSHSCMEYLENIPLLEKAYWKVYENRSEICSQ